MQLICRRFLRQEPSVHTRTAAARLALRLIGFLVLYHDNVDDIMTYWYEGACETVEEIHFVSFSAFDNSCKYDECFIHKSQCCRVVTSCMSDTIEQTGRYVLVLRGTTVLPRHRGTIFLRYQYRGLYGSLLFSTAIPQLPRFFGTVLSDVDTQ